MTARLVAARVSFALTTLVGCAGSPVGPSGAVVPGVWGGDHVTLTIRDSGSHLEFDCAHGEIPGSLIPDRRGQFAAPGVFVRERGGPIREGDPPDAHPATYAGTLTTRSMQLTVRLSQTNELIGTFALTQGGAGRVVKCL
ncbi:MAG: hypothetical protein HOP16_20875 [Acidobacteria bacterium]|nr:hypothetical protein [Acidobacteriota bacterium]